MASFPAVYTPMGITAENVAKKFNVSRRDQDEFAAKSQDKAIAAPKASRFDAEIVPVKAIAFNGNERVLADFKIDEMPRAGTTADSLATLKPAFSVTAGNASPLSDGAAAVLVATDAKAKSLGGARAATRS
jgi:acetyl-CoA acyltransferase